MTETNSQGGAAMSDNARRFHIIRKRINTLYPGHPKGNFARHLNTLAGFMSGIVGSKSVNLPKVASAVPDGCKTTSREKRLTRFVKNKNIDLQQYFLPFAIELLQNLPNGIMVFAIDGSVVGRNCITLMVNVIFQGRSLPIVWIVVEGKKGHLPEDLHVKLVKKLKPLVPDGRKIVFLGDGEFDGVVLQKTINEFGWKYVCRTGINVKMTWEGGEIACGEALPFIKVDQYMEFDNVLFTRKKYGPVMVVCYWKEGCKEPIFLVSNMESVEDACVLYSLRFRIETFFSDQKSRGFNLHKSHLSDPERLSRLLIATCLAYIWIIYLGVVAKKRWVGIIHRTERCDLSLFQLGLRLLEHFINEGMKIPVSFTLCVVGQKSVR
jgi:hypothetical protein